MSARQQVMESALNLAARGFHVFPLRPDSKLPALKGWQQEATRDPARIKQWFSKRDQGIGISTSKFGDNRALLAIDVDVKGLKNGNNELLRMELEGKELPGTTLEQRTASGGRHLFFLVDEPVKQGVDVLAPGLDIRSSGGFVVGAGTVLGGGQYTINDAPIAEAPQWLIDACGRAPARPKNADVDLSRVDPVRAQKRAIDYLLNEAPPSIEDAGGDDNLFRVACRLKDFGVDQDKAVELLMDHWNDRCSPPWSPEDLAAKVRNAYAYGQEPAGVSAPEAQFPPIDAAEIAEMPLHPLDSLNVSHAFVMVGSDPAVLWETTDADGKPDVRYLGTEAFRSMYAPVKIQVDGEKFQPLAKAWLEWKGRRQFDGVIFDPRGKSDPRFYNRWRGFDYEPLPKGVEPPKVAVKAWDRFASHINDHIAHGDPALAHWVMSWLADIFQRPDRLPKTALALRGGKGNGKSIVSDVTAVLLGPHHVSAADEKRVFGQFNGHTELALVMTLEEAVWSGDKRNDSKLKDLVTAHRRQIERKGFDVYSVASFLRVIILGNADWIVPATDDERRYAVFDVANVAGDKRQYFAPIWDHVLNGDTALPESRRYFLRRFMEFDTAGADVSVIPRTQALARQVERGADGPVKFLKSCLSSGAVPSAFPTDWPEAEVLQIPRRTLYDSYLRGLRERHEHEPKPYVAFFRDYVRPWVGYADGWDKVKTGVLLLPPLNVARQNYASKLGGTVDWGD